MIKKKRLASDVLTNVLSGNKSWQIGKKICTSGDQGDGILTLETAS